VSAHLVDRAVIYDDLWADVVLLARRDPAEAWRPLGDGRCWCRADVRAIFLAGVLRTMHAPWLAEAAAYLLGGLAAAGVELRAAHLDDAEDAETRRLLWALACAHAGADIVRGGA
jgi:hypothetical protein